MHVELTACFILHSRSYLESSLLLDIFSREYGRLHLIAKGAKRKKSPFSGLLQPYQRLLMAWRGRSELMTLTDVETDAESYNLLGERVIAGFYVNELLVRLLHKYESHPELFDLYSQAISDLSIVDSIAIVLRFFEKGLLESLGYGLILDRDVDEGKMLVASEKYYYLIDSGPMRNVPCTGNYIEITGNSLLALRKGCLQSKTELKETKCLMRFILQNHIGNKPLLSRTLYKAYTQTI